MDTYWYKIIRSTIAISLDHLKIKIMDLEFSR